MSEYYTSGAFAKKAKVTIRTIRFYDKEGLLKPKAVNESGYRLYTDQDFIKLQRILFFKSLGFSLQEIRTMIEKDSAVNLSESLLMQLKLLQQKIAQLKIMEQSIESALSVINKEEQIDEEQMMRLLHLSNMDRTLVEQYKNETNLTVRIALHERYSENKTGWFLWLFDQIHFFEGQKLAELGCGNGQLWMNEKLKSLPKLNCLITDSSYGMMEDAKKNITRQLHTHGLIKASFHFETADCEHLLWEKKSFDAVIANHLLFYVHDPERVVHNIAELIKDGGYFYCSTYGHEHMKEIRELTKEFDPEITLSEVALYEQFGLQNGEGILAPYFQSVEKRIYPDRLIINEVDPLFDYIMSCHGNQNERLGRRQAEFKQFLQRKIEETGELVITKYAGVFICRK